MPQLLKMLESKKHPCLTELILLNSFPLNTKLGSLVSEVLIILIDGKAAVELGLGSTVRVEQTWADSCLGS